jgi:chromosomal replication initiator protein
MEKFPYWQEWLSEIKKLVSEETFLQYFKGIRPLRIEGTKAIVQVAETVDINRLTRRYLGLLEDAYFEVSNREIEFSFETLREAQFVRQEAVRFSSLPGIALSSEFSFENFVVGHNNEFAWSAAIAVAKDPGGSKFNPLLIYGGSGLGKTHLIQSIGNYVKDFHPEKNVRYISSDDFVREYVESLQNKKIAQLSQYYRNEVDLLLMDDIQFLSGKMETQNEFFHIFNALHQTGKQVVLTSDAPPSEVKGLEDRLISRFQWGLTVDIQPPDVETREAILRKKADLNQLELSDEVIAYISKHVDTNVRILEGIVRKLLLYSSLHKQEISLEMAKEMVSTLVSTVRRRINVDDVVRSVSEYYNVEEDKILEGGRGTKEVAQARQVCMYILKDLTSLSLKSIGKRFGDRDHSTVVHAVKTISKNMEKDPNFKRVIDSLKGKLQ